MNLVLTQLLIATVLLAIFPVSKSKLKSFFKRLKEIFKTKENEYFDERNIYS